MEVKDLALRSLVQSLQTLQMKDIEGENVRTAVSYEKVRYSSSRTAQSSLLIPTEYCWTL